MTIEDEKQKNQKLIDPDILSLFTVGIGGLAAISGFYQVYLVRQDQIQKAGYSQADFLGFQRNIKEVKRSIHYFKSTIDQLEEFIGSVNMRDRKGKDIFS